MEAVECTPLRRWMKYRFKEKSQPFLRAVGFFPFTLAAEPGSFLKEAGWRFPRVLWLMPETLQSD
jgi:hypothetical protein